jgi:HK97 family phage major capsid protein
MENLVVTPEQLKEVVNRKVQDTLRASNPLNVQSNSNGYVRIKADHDSHREQARVIADYILAVHKGREGAADDIARKANEKYLTRANFNTGTATQGGAAVPQFWIEEIMNFADRFGYARALAKIYPMRGKTENLVSSGAFTGAVVAEGSGLTLTDSTSFFTATAMTAKKIVAGAIVSEEQLQDATPAFLDYVINGLGRALAETEDKQFFNGNGSGANFTGLTGTSGTTVVRQGGSDSSGKDTFGEISWTDLWNLRLGINSGVGANGSFVVPQSVFGYLMKETGGSRPIFDMVRPIEIASIGLTALEGNSYFTPTGRPMHVVPDSLFPSSAANTASAFYADWNQFTVMGIREDVSVNEYTEYFGATGLGGTHQKGIEVVERVAFAFPAPSAIGVLKTSTT